MVTVEQLVKIAPTCKSKAPLYVEWLNKAMLEFNIDSVSRQASFLAQIIHESGCLVYMREIASGSAYEFRKDLGNTVAGDGIRYKGRGLIQITGKANYTAVMMALDIDCVEHPELLETPENACRSAAWFWSSHGLSVLADKEDTVGITRRVNGGTLGLANRIALFNAAKNVLKGNDK